jgi:hypothetical protein
MIRDDLDVKPNDSWDDVRGGIEDYRLIVPNRLFDASSVEMHNNELL